ncbi:uncharacterized protein PHACADRAFT_258304 [Phanerochaete carnosa HHB-10118-sp]|uniref:Uncharacterized protein n=1 Tax=Phanerochaete carnosa (strain HHB-10118-sp) TaxID=650164 RepID=K5W5N9_PHACS|nr:uncharacterized protein PHACADRAFT_258304 [Phanerochaete carnosa HHB-10118-sp]EKM54455.1 hypothetical protein PHACADRAFT_258304 [Phanerochaete carnosa HHB-10118-sp]
MNVHVFASSLPTSQHIHHQASILVHDADSSHKWFDIALPVLAPGELKPADVSDLDDFVHTAALGADASAPSLADARRSLSRQKSSLDPAASKVSSISLGPASPAHLSTELPSLPASQLALLSTTNNVSLNKIPPSRDTPLSDQLHMHNSSQSASRQPGGTPQSQQPHGTHKEQNNFHPTQSLADMTRDVSGAFYS